MIVGTSCCPVCRARFRASSLCSRCGADLTALMLLAAHAWALRQSARQLLRRGECEAALASAQEAQRLQATQEGALLCLIGTAAVMPVEKGSAATREISEWARTCIRG